MSGARTGPGTLARLSLDDAGEVLTLQRAAFVTEARAHNDHDLPPLTQTLEALRAELSQPGCLGWGIRERGRLTGCVRAHVGPDSAELVRLAVAPDRQGHGIGARLLRAAEELLPAQVRTIRLFTGEHSHANLDFYRRHGYRLAERSPAAATADGGGSSRRASYQLIHLVKTRPGGH
jgi:ribosomal protein S18 acetylase RimI-like enzyme